MEQILIYIKHHFRFIWNLIEKINGWLFRILYGKKMHYVVRNVMERIEENLFTYRVLTNEDVDLIHEFVNDQPLDDIRYFSPHPFDRDSIRKMATNSSFLMMGAFYDQKLVGYFFLRFFINRKSFVGRLIDRDYRGKGIGNTMNLIMYEIAWKMKFRCLSTISRKNYFVMKAHKKNRRMVILKELQNDYMLVEFIPDMEKS